PGPDFPTGGFILGRSGILDYYTRGRGSMKLRARAATEKSGKDREAIIVTEIPFQVNKARLIEQIAALVADKKLEGISDVRDESDRDGMRIVIELKRGEQAEIVLNNLYKHTQMQINFGVIMLSIVNGQPRELGIIDVIKRFLEHRTDVVRRRTDYLLRKARDREHLLLGFQKALDLLDEVIQLIRASRTPREAREGLIASFEFTEKQAQAIIELQLQRLTGMERQKILDELADIQRMIAQYLEILGSEAVLKAVIAKELKEVQKDFGDDRRTEIIEDTGELRLEDLVQMEDVAVTVSRGGYLKRTAVDTYRRQTRGAKGRIGMGTRSEDVVEHLVIASTHAYMLIFTNKGRVYWLKIYELPDAGTASKGKHVSGVIKKCELTEFNNPRSAGIIAVALDDDDELLGAKITNGQNFIFLGSHDGMAIRFREDEVRAMGRPARGVRAMDLRKGDYLVGVAAVEEDGLILTLSENGYGKRTPLSEYRLTGRGCKGVINMKVTNKIGKVVEVLPVSESTDLMVITRNGQIIRVDSDTIR